MVQQSSRTARNCSVGRNCYTLRNSAKKKIALPWERALLGDMYTVAVLEKLVLLEKLSFFEEIALLGDTYTVAVLEKLVLLEKFNFFEEIALPKEIALL